MLLNSKLNDTSHKMLWAEAAHTRERVQNSIATTGSTKRPLAIFYGQKTNNIALFSEFGIITYVTNWINIKKQIMDNMYNAIMVGYTDNHTRDTYTL